MHARLNMARCVDCTVLRGARPEPEPSLELPEHHRRDEHHLGSGNSLDGIRVVCPELFLAARSAASLAARSSAGVGRQSCVCLCLCLCLDVSLGGSIALLPAPCATPRGVR